MSGDMWVVFLVACAGFGAWELIKSRSARADAPPQPKQDEQGFPDARQGTPPHPHARIIDMPGGAMRLIDLRSLPVEDLRVARLGLVQEQQLLERPVHVQIWIAPVDIVREWTKMADVALIIMNGRLCSCYWSLPT